MPNDIQILTEPIKIGDISGNNYLKVYPDGSIQLIGKATMWEDMTTSLAGKKLEDNTGKVDYRWDENAIKFQSGGSISVSKDRVIWNYQKLHGIKCDSEMHMHAHFRQPSNKKFVFTMQHRIQYNGAVTTTAWTTTTCNTTDDCVWDYPGSGNFNNIIVFPAIDMSGMEMSDILEFRLARTDVQTGDLWVKYIDAHCEFDTFGSRTEWSK